ncbi:MAG: hypothetical protein ACXABD_14015 [Candidatus Thorarchaeota archaeon]|jgi:hypothetical protein
MSTEYTLSDYKLQAYLLGIAKDLASDRGRPSSPAEAYNNETGLDVYIKKTESTTSDQESGMVPANSLTPVGALNFVTDLPDNIYDTLTFEANVYKVYLNEGREGDREISIPLPHNSQKFFGDAGANLARQGNTFKQTRTFLQQEALQNEYFTSQRFVSEALTGENASKGQGVQIGNIEIVRLGGNPAEIETNITVKMTLFATRLDNYFATYYLPDEEIAQYLYDLDLSDELIRSIEGGVRWIDLIKINLDDGGGRSALEQFAARQGVATEESVIKDYLNNSLAYNASQQKIKLELKYNTEGLEDAVKNGDILITEEELETYKQQIRAQTEVYYLNLHQNAINFNAADRSVEIQIDYVASTGVNTIERKTDLLFEPFLYEKELQLNDSICRLQKQIETQEPVLVLVDPFGANKVQEQASRPVEGSPNEVEGSDEDLIETEYDPGSRNLGAQLVGGPEVFDYGTLGRYKLIRSPEEKRLALEEASKAKKRLSVIQANKLINGLYAYSLFPADQFNAYRSSTNFGAELFTRSKILFVPKRDVINELVIGRQTTQEYGIIYAKNIAYFQNSGPPAAAGNLFLFNYLAQEFVTGGGRATGDYSAGEVGVLNNIVNISRAAQTPGVQDSELQAILDKSLGDQIPDLDEVNIEYVFFGEIIETAFEVLASNNRFGEQIGTAPITLEDTLKFNSSKVVRVERGETMHEIDNDDRSIQNLEMFVEPFYLSAYKGIGQPGGPVQERIQQLYREFGEILFTDITYNNPVNTNEEITINLADLPISMIEFKKWFVNNISSKRRKHLFLKNYIEMLLRWVSKLVGDAVGQDLTKTTDLEPPELLINTYFINADKYDFLPNFIETDPLTAGVRRPHALDNRVSIGELKKYLDAQSTNEARLNSKTLIIIGQTPNLKFETREREGNKQKDKEVNIPHILYGGATKGLLNDISFQREDMRGLREARLFEGESMYALDILREKYNATIRFRGNNFFKPGMMLYLDPSAFGAQVVLGNSRDPVSPARLLGLGGYHLVIRVSHEIDLTTNVWYTYVDTQWQTYGEDDGVTKSKEDNCITSLIARLSQATSFSIDNGNRPTARARSIAQEILAEGDLQLLEGVVQQDPEFAEATDLTSALKVRRLKAAGGFDLYQELSDGWASRGFSPDDNALTIIEEIDRRLEADESIDDILRQFGD